MAQETLKEPFDLFRFQLRSSLTMEEHSLEALGELEQAVNDSKIKKLLTHHAEETRQQIDNLKQVFGLLDLDVSTAPSPSTTGITKQARSLLKRSSPSLQDEVALLSALGTEHYEIAVYQALVLQAQSLDNSEAAALLQENLDQEVHTSEELSDALRKLLS